VAEPVTPDAPLMGRVTAAPDTSLLATMASSVYGQQLQNRLLCRSFRDSMYSRQLSQIATEQVVAEPVTPDAPLMGRVTAAPDTSLLARVKRGRCIIQR
jgi:hypothetical protein